MKKTNLLIILLCLSSAAFGQYLRTDGTNSMTGTLNVERQGYASMELRSNTGSFIDFHSSITSDFDARIIWNYNNSNELGFYGNATFKNGFKVNGSTTLLGNVTNAGTSFILNNNSQQNATLWFTNPASGPTSVGHYYLKAFDYWGAYLHFEGAGDNGNENLNVTIDGRVGVGTTSPAAKLHVHQSSELGATNGNQLLLTRISGKTSNTMMNNIWLVRDDNGSNWFTARVHDGISVDASYLDPGVNSRTWWERDPYHNIQQWGHAGSTYMTLKSGKLGIGTTTPVAKLSVNGDIRATEVKVLTDVNSVPDYVFAPDYDLRSLEETKAYIEANKHLPEIPSAAEIGEEGLDLGDMNLRLLKKIEELTLHQIDLLERLKKLEKTNQTLQSEVSELKNR